MAISFHFAREIIDRFGSGMPYLLIDLKGYSATAAGAALLPMPLVIAMTAPMVGRLAAKFGPRLPLTIGPAVVAIGFLLALRLRADESYWAATLPAMLVISLGMAGAVAPLTTAVLGSHPRTEAERQRQDRPGWRYRVHFRRPECCGLPLAPAWLLVSPPGRRTRRSRCRSRVESGFSRVSAMLVANLKGSSTAG